MWSSILVSVRAAQPSEITVQGLIAAVCGWWHGSHRHPNIPPSHSRSRTPMRLTDDDLGVLKPWAVALNLAPPPTARTPAQPRG
ncbi:intracellular growth attenuator family protein [Streptomyces sp. CB02115]|uniref:intracellular growth attenuator family protein n=1 Tax=Streptomyces sp. CB02115 TaxID=1703939 RepID=UPI00116137ED|nr:intracellular growth attenuator family protein [Streptomyces sp. CB02115]